MESKVNYTVVGFFVVVFTILSVVAAVWLSEYRHAKVYKTYLVYMNEPAAGLSVNSSVEFNGVKVGYVKSINLNRKDLQQVELTLKIEEDIPITEATTATLMMQGLTGITNVGLKSTRADAPILLAKPGEKYPVIPAEPSFLMELGKAVRNVTKSMKDISDAFNRVLDKDNSAAIKKTLANLEKITNAIAKNNKEIDQILKNADVLFKNAGDASKRLPDVMSSLEKTLISFNKMSVALRDAGVQVTSTMKNGSVLMTQLSSQTAPEATRLLQTLNNAALNIEIVTNKLRQNPSILIRGTTPAPPGPGEAAR